MLSPRNSSNLELLLAIVRDIEAASDTEQALHRLIAAASELTNSETAFLLEFDEYHHTFRFVVSPYFHQGTFKATKVPIEESIAGWIFENNKPLVIQDVAKDARSYKEVDLALASNFPTNSLLAVPISYQGSMFGVLEVVNKLHNEHYTEVDVTILEIVSQYIAMTLWISNQEKRFQSSRDKYAELDRLKSDFIAISSHELRTPLGLILGHASVLKEKTAEEHHQPIDIIIQNSIRLKEIIKDLTDVKNFETGVARVRKQVISISGLIDKVVLSFQEMAAGKNISIQSEVPDKRLQLEGDESKLTIAISNLVRNAITFTNEGGHVSVKAEAENEHVQISVKDNGVGIPDSAQEKVFDRFFQVEPHLTRRASGMGLGLSVAKTVVDLHGGQIWAESVENQGSTFSILLPLDPPE